MTALAVAVSAFVRAGDQENFGGPAEAFSEGWGPAAVRHY